MDSKTPAEIWGSMEEPERALLLTLCGHTGGCCVGDADYRRCLHKLHARGVARYKAGRRGPPREATPIGRAVAEYGRKAGA